MNDPELYKRIERLENQNQAIIRSLIAAYQTLHAISLQLPNQSMAIHDRTLINNQIAALATLKPRNTQR